MTLQCPIPPPCRPIHGPAPPQGPLQQPQVTRESATGLIRCLLGIWAQPQGCSLFLEPSSMSPPRTSMGGTGHRSYGTAAATRQVQDQHLCLGAPRADGGGQAPPVPMATGGCSRHLQPLPGGHVPGSAGCSWRHRLSTQGSGGLRPRALGSWPSAHGDVEACTPAGCWVPRAESRAPVTASQRRPPPSRGVSTCRPTRSLRPPGPAVAGLSWTR